MNAPMYLALFFFGIFVFVQPNFVANDKGILVDDMMFTQEQYENRFGSGIGKFRRALGVKDSSRLWPNGVIPYSINTEECKKPEWGLMCHYFKMRMKRAMDEWQSHTCLKFVQKSGKAMINIVSHKGCWSSVGRTGNAQDLNLGMECWKHPTLLHELGHAIGLAHEQSRPDRDDFVTINFGNIKKQNAYNFYKSSNDTFTTFDSDYDYLSIMHYSADGFAVQGTDAITTKDPAMQKRIGHSKHLSYRDIKVVNIMYNCKDSSGQCDLEDSDCPDDGLVDKTCSCMCPSPNGLDQFPVPCLPTSNGTMNGNASLISP